MPTNFYMIFVAALIPFLLGALWYGPLFGKSWMRINGFTEEYLNKGNMLVIFGLSYLFMVMLAFALTGSSIHQASIYGLFMPEIQDTTSSIYADAVSFFEKYGDRHRTFKHGAVHGLVFSLFAALPLVAVNALFERRGWKYIAVHWGYWALSIILMSGLLCATLKFGSL